MSLPETIVSDRLRLSLWSAEEAADVAAGRRRPEWHADFPRPDDRDSATLWAAGDPWGPRSIVRGRTVLGSIGFFGPPEGGPAGDPAGDAEDGADGVEDATPEPAEVEVGYGLVAEARGWGFATEALQALLAHTDALGVRVRASVSPDNRASIRVLAKCGFTGLRGGNEDGELVMVRPLR